MRLVKEWRPKAVTDGKDLAARAHMLAAASMGATAFQKGLVAMTIGGFATLTMLTKNSFLDQINQQYVNTARAKGLSERRVPYGHVFRNAMLIVIAGFPGAFVSILFTGSLLIEVIFSLDGDRKRTRLNSSH